MECEQKWCVPCRLSHENPLDMLLLCSFFAWLARKEMILRETLTALLNGHKPVCAFSECLTVPFFPKIPVSAWTILQLPLRYCWWVLFNCSPRWIPMPVWPSWPTHIPYALWSSTLLHEMTHCIFSGWLPEWSLRGWPHNLEVLRS